MSGRSGCIWRRLGLVLHIANASVGLAPFLIKAFLFRHSLHHSSGEPFERGQTAIRGRFSLVWRGAWGFVFLLPPRKSALERLRLHVRPAAQ